METQHSWSLRRLLEQADETDALLMAEEQMHQLLHTQPAFADRFIAHISERQASLEADLANQLLNSTERRLVRALLVLAEHNDQHLCHCTLPDVSQTFIAEMIGTTRARVNVLMSRFKKIGLIKDQNGRLELQPSLLLAADGRPHRVSNGTSAATGSALA